MNNRIGYATIGFFDRDIDAALDVIADVGFDQAELFCDDPHIAPVAVVGGRIVGRPAVRDELEPELGTAPPAERDGVARPLRRLLNVLEHGFVPASVRTYDGRRT